MKLRSWTSGIAGLILIPQLSFATLGEPLASVQKDAGSLKASQKAVSSTQDYTSSEMVADGNTIKQYSNREGIVFAVSWRGISKPDLQVLFGSYFQEYIDASNEIPKQIGVKSLSFKTTKMVVRRSGRMRDQHGLAYVPSLVPPGVKVEDLP